MDPWKTLRRTWSLIYLSYGPHSTTADLFATDFRLKTSPDFELSLDLTESLRTRSKSSGSYLDARSLADGEIKNFTMLQIDEEQVVNGLEQALDRLNNKPSEWRLTIILEDEWTFRVKPKLQQGTLFLHAIPEGK